MSYIVDNSYKTNDKLTVEEKDALRDFDLHMKTIDNLPDGPQKQTAMRKAQDSFTNISARLGLGSESLNEGAGYHLTRFTYSYPQLIALFRNSWIIQKGISIPAVDMHRNGILIKSELEPDQIKQLEKGIKEQKQKLIEGRKWGRLFGGAVGILLFDNMYDRYVEGIDGQKAIVEYPLEIDDIAVGSFKGIYILDRWNGVSPSGELEDDKSSYHYGQPKYYTINLPDQPAIRLHHSWVLPFLGTQLPRLERYADTYWGMSEVEPVIREVQKRDNANFSVANLIFQASLRVLKLKDLRLQMARGSEEFQKEITSRFDQLTKHQSNQRMTLIDKDDEFQIHSTQFAGLDDILETFMEDIAGAFRIPMDRLWGRPGKGFSGDDKSSLRNYNEYIENQQEEHERHNYQKLLDIICKSELGFIPDDLDFDFVSMYDSDMETRRSEMEQKALLIQSFYNDGIILKSVALKEAKQLQKYGLFDNITDDMVAQAEEDEKLDLGEEDSEEFMLEEEEETTKTKDGLWKIFKRKK